MRKPSGDALPRLDPMADPLSTTARRRERKVEIQGARRGSARLEVDDRALAGHVGGDANDAEVIRRAAFQEDTLPDAADRPVPALLSMRNLRERKAELGVRVGSGVDDPHDQRVVIIETQGGGDGKFEGEIPTLVL